MRQRGAWVMSRTWLLGMVAVMAGGALWAEEPSRSSAPTRPPWQRLLQGEDARKAAEQQKRLSQLWAAGDFAEALQVADAQATFRREVQGADHWQTADARWHAEAMRRVLKQGQPAREKYASLVPFINQAIALEEQRRFREAEPFHQKALNGYRDVLGEDHPYTGTGCYNLGCNLDGQGRFREGEGLLRKALAIYRKALGEEHPNTAACWNDLGLNLQMQGKYREAEQSFRQALAVRQKVLGEAHSDTAQSDNSLGLTLQAQGKYRDAEQFFRRALVVRRKVLGAEHPETAQSVHNLAFNLNARGRYTEAEPLYRQALNVYRKAFGEGHPETAQVIDNLALNLQAQGKFEEAEGFFRQALDVRRKVLGADHLHTARSYHNLALYLNTRGKYAEAEENYRRALNIFRKALDEDHPTTAHAYDSLAWYLLNQGRFVEAAEASRRALTIRRQLLGEEHPETAQSYHSLATILGEQGRYTEAEAAFRTALAIYRKTLGEKHNLTALAYNTLGTWLQTQGKYAEAEEALRKALAIQLQTLGEEHLETALGHFNLAANLHAQGKYAEAEAGCRRALAIRLAILGENHAIVAISYNNLAFNLEAQGLLLEAEKLYRKALGIRLQVLSEEHPSTLTGYDNLAFNLNLQGRHEEAEKFWRHAANSFAVARLRIARNGLDRASRAGERSPLPYLAAVLARNGKPQEAWQRFEEDLARGTWDDLSARLHRPPAEQARLTELNSRLDRLDRLIEKAAAVRKPTDEQDQQRLALLAQRRQAQDQLETLANHLEKTYGPAAGQVFDRRTVQASLPADAALVGWLDLPAGPHAADPNGEHWAVLLRSAGPPVWVRLRGSGLGGAWTEDDSRLPADLRAALLSPRGEWQALARRLRRQRLDPLADHLAAGGSLPAVRRLVVLPSTALAGVPTEVFADGWNVSYVPSGTLHAYLRRLPPLTSAGLLAVADPIFEQPAETDKPPSLPPGGALITLVSPRSNAASSNLKPNDVLIRYNGVDLSGPADLEVVPESDDPARRVRMTVWREGRMFERQVKPGRLGVVFASEPAPRAIAEQHRLSRRLTAAARGGSQTWPPLPGTRTEAEALRRLFGDTAATLLLDAQASEQGLDQLARSGKLVEYRYVHLATHGEVDDRLPLNSAVILSREGLPAPDKQLDAGLPVYDGRLTAEEVRRHWELRSDLVTLSACETALGRYEGGEGYVGFAQALLLKGSRSVCLSLWKVNDATTALLMERFYRNLLGKREGLKEPLGKAAALAEAREWLRTLPREEALRRVAQLSKGVERGKGRPALPPPPEVPPAAAGQASTEDRPYAHPYYWAPFVLIGNPD
jgi:tetratricopeptide (TPR) repeat protein